MSFVGDAKGGVLYEISILQQPLFWHLLVNPPVPLFAVTTALPLIVTALESLPAAVRLPPPSMVSAALSGTWQVESNR